MLAHLLLCGRGDGFIQADGMADKGGTFRRWAEQRTARLPVGGDFGKLRHVVSGKDRNEEQGVGVRRVGMDLERHDEQRLPRFHGILVLPDDGRNLALQHQSKLKRLVHMQKPVEVPVQITVINAGPDRIPLLMKKHFRLRKINSGYYCIINFLCCQVFSDIMKSEKER